MKAATLQEGSKILQQIAPKAGDHDYNKKEQLYHTLARHYQEQLKLSQKDPAKFVEDLYVEEIPKEIPLTTRLLLRKQLQEQKGIPSYNQRYLMESEKNDYLQRLQSQDPIRKE